MTAKEKSISALSVSFEEPEVDELVSILEGVLGEMRVELHHTHTPDFRDQLKKREGLIRGIVEKLGKGRA